MLYNSAAFYFMCRKLTTLCCFKRGNQTVLSLSKITTIVYDNMHTHD